MGACLSIPEPPVQYSNAEMDAAQGVAQELGLMNSAITKETSLLVGCKQTASALFNSIRHKPNSSLDVVNLAVVTEKLDEMIDHFAPLKRTLMNLIQRANHEYNEFARDFVKFRRSERTMAGVMTVQSAATSLSPGLYNAVQIGKQIRREAEAICKLLQEKYSEY